MTIPFIPLVTTMHMLVASSGTPPRIDIAKTCRASTDSIIKLFGKETMITIDSCLKQENDALEQMKKDWVTYTGADRSHCVQQSGYMPSYVEWLTCFEMEVQLRRIRKEQPPASAAEQPISR
jgi:hypothetical protein